MQRDWSGTKIELRIHRIFDDAPTSSASAAAVECDEISSEKMCQNRHKMLDQLDGNVLSERSVEFIDSSSLL